MAVVSVTNARGPPRCADGIEKTEGRLSTSADPAASLGEGGKGKVFFYGVSWQFWERLSSDAWA